ncbi:chymotrypsin inhibitor-like [Ptiloglossa arizonensis]|uniref:chymotrypsin inhibitor-like n=1 Tax=Ptiloglossa arizonensis TaxID=3350558 RepID=UPI003FA0EE8A
MFRLVLTLFALLTIFSTTASSCGENAIANSCGTACPQTCEYPEPQNCIAVCVSGCFCKPGYLLNNSGRCVRPADC